MCYRGGIDIGVPILSIVWLFVYIYSVLTDLLPSKPKQHYIHTIKRPNFIMLFPCFLLFVFVFIGISVVYWNDTRVPAQ